MPFGLKNTRATYQWVVKNISTQLIRHTMDIYNDMMTKNEILYDTFKY